MERNARSKQAKAITHLAYADDTIIFFKGETKGYQKVKEILHHYYWISGQEINFSKSELIFSPNTKNEDKLEWSKILNVRFSPHLCKYLGVWIDAGRRKNLVYQDLIGRIVKKLDGWKTQLISQAARMTLIKTVIASSCIYQLSCVLLPKKYARLIDMHCANFFWGKNQRGSNCANPKRWKKLCQKKSKGGLRFRPTYLLNKALLAKQSWRIISSHQSTLIGRTLKRKYRGYPKCQNKA